MTWIKTQAGIINLNHIRHVTITAVEDKFHVRLYFKIEGLGSYVSIEFPTEERANKALTAIEAALGCVLADY